MYAESRIVTLGPPLLYLVSHLRLYVNYSAHNPRDKNMNFNLMELLPRLKSGICDQRTIYSILRAYKNLNNKIKLSKVNIFKDSFAGDIMISDSVQYNTYNYLSMINPEFNPKNYKLEDVIKCNIYDTNYHNENAYNLIDEYILAYGITDATTALKLSQSNFYGLPDMLTLGYLIEDLLTNYNDEAACQLYNNNKIKLYVAIIETAQNVKEYLNTIDPRDDNNNAFYLAKYILSAIIDSHKEEVGSKWSGDDDMIGIVNILTDNIIIRNWYEKQVLSVNIESILGPSDIPDNLHLYIRQLLK